MRQRVQAYEIKAPVQRPALPAPEEMQPGEVLTDAHVSEVRLCYDLDLPISYTVIRSYTTNSLGFASKFVPGPNARYRLTVPPQLCHAPAIRPRTVRAAPPA